MVVDSRSGDNQVIVQWNGEFDSVQMLWLLLCSLLLLVSLLPGCLVLLTRGLRFQDTLVGPAQGLRFAIAHTMAWVLILFSLAFGPSAGTISGSGDAAAPSGMEQMIREASQTEDLGHLFGRGGVLGDLHFAGFRNLEVQGNSDEPHFASRRPHHSVSLAAFLCLQLSIYLCAVLTVVAVASTSRATPARILLFSLIWGSLVYAPAAHWVWGEGWLGIRGAIDFGGSLFMLIVSGSVLGILRYCRDETTYPDQCSPWVRWDGIIQHVSAAAFLFGYLMLMCSLSVPVSQLRAVAFLNGIIAACGGFLVYGVLQMLIPSRNRQQTSVMGFLCGTISVAAGCTVFDPQTALTCGVLGGAAGFTVCAVAFRFRLPMAYETALSASVAAVLAMLIMGISGSSANGVLHWNREPINSIMHGETALLGIQALAVVCVLVYVFIASRLLSSVFLRPAR